jgi:predicted XRE-type DNA-binding protein
MTIRTSGLVFKIAFRAKAPAVAAPVPAREPVRDRTERRPETKIERPTPRRARPRRVTRARVVSGTSRLARMLALAYRIERAIEDGELRDLAEAAERLGISRPRVTQLARLAVLSPAIQEAIVKERLRLTERELRPVSNEFTWSRQEAMLRRLLGAFDVVIEPAVTSIGPRLDFDARVDGDSLGALFCENPRPQDRTLCFLSA